MSQTEFRPVNVCRACSQPTPQCICGPVRECPSCNGRGFHCWDDLCRAQGRCMHDDAQSYCGFCESEGVVPPEEALVVPDEAAQAIREYTREHPNIRKTKYAYDDRDPLTGACYPVAEAYYHLNDCELDVYCLSWSDVDPAYDGTHWYLREPDGEQRWIDLTLELMPPVEFPPFAKGRRRGFITGDEPSKRARKVLDAVGGEAA